MKVDVDQAGSGRKEQVVSESSEIPSQGGASASGPSSTGTTYAPPDMPWVVPSEPDGSGGAGGGPPYGYPLPAGGPPSPPPAHRATGLPGLVAAFLLTAVIAFFVGGQLRTGGTTALPRFATPTNPFVASEPAPSTATGNSSLSSTEISTIAAKVAKGVVDIDTELGYQSGRAAGTGMVLTSTGEVLTNNHVIAGSTKITVTVVDTGKSYTAHVVGTDPMDDVAVIQLENASGLKTVTPAKPASVSVGDPVVALGNAGGRGGAPSVVTGSIVSLGQTITATDENGGNAQQLTDLIEVDAPIESGDSGGPLANSSGDVIGMDSAAEVSGTRFRAAGNSGYAIRIEKALGIAQQIEAGKASDTIHLGLPAFLGVQVAGSQGRGGSGRVAPAPSGGALVAGVEPDTAAASIGLAAGDTITSVNGRTIDSGSTLTTVLRTLKPGDEATVGWTDQSGTTHTGRGKLTTGPAD